MKTFEILVHTIDERDRAFIVVASDKREAVGAFIDVWDERLVSYTIVSITEVK